MPPQNLASVTLDDKYRVQSGRIYLSGVQALVRLMLVQRWRDQTAGLNTAGFVSGYRGSPLGGLDEALWKAKSELETNAIKFLPGVNEELAATAVWGTQQVHLTGEAKFDGVFALWYGKGPGVDRCGDVFKHMSHAGTSPHGGVLLVAGDDHGAYSSTLPNQSDHLFAASMIPMLYPHSVDEYIELGLHGFAMSRYAGLPVGFKALADTVESSSSIAADVFDLQFKLPDDFVLPSDGVHARLSADTLGVQARKQEALMQDAKIYAAVAYARANKLNRITIDSPDARLGIVASGKSYRDVLEALEELGIDEEEAARVGIRLLKVSMPWPLEPDSIREFADGLEEILVVEEKRQIVEYQLKEHLYNWRESARPRVIGKFGEQGEWGAHPRGEWLLPATADFSVAQIARVIAARVARFHTSERIRARLAILDAKDAVLAQAQTVPPRPAWYCSGCPHNTSTRVPDGSLALAGIGCHVMATAIYPDHNRTTPHMGGEGATWLGQAWFSQRPHVFANLGDGTYYHSGSMAIRAAVAAGVNITYKILYNDAVAMTGGQPVDGPISVPRILQQVAAEGVMRIALVSEDPTRWADRRQLPPNNADFLLTVHHRDDMEPVQRALREFRGVSVLVYDQVCAAEKRRRRKKGDFPPAKRRVFINEDVCEGCGDCGTQSNCTALLPQSTEYGMKRQVDQSACNFDESCIKGFCPSFVTVEGVRPRRQPPVQAAPIADETLPDPIPPTLDAMHNILITGIGGTGVITIGALIGMAAHLEGKGVSVLDMTGMSQKNGSVTSHVRLARDSSQLLAQRIPTGEADLVLGCDMLTAAAPDAIARMRPGRTYVLANTFEQPTGHFAQEPDWVFPATQARTLIEESCGNNMDFVDATLLAKQLMGDAIAANLFLLGFAFQKGKVPVSAEALNRAIALNGVAVAVNQQAFRWGRMAASNLAAVTRFAQPAQTVRLQMPASSRGLEALIADRVSQLTAYQDAGYAQRYVDLVNRVRAAEQRVRTGSYLLTRVVAQNLYKLMAYKDEYEVARLYTDGRFQAKLKQQFEGRPVLRLYMAPPVLGRRDATGRPRKSSFGPWMLFALRMLVPLRRLRGTALDPFGWTVERRIERQLIADYIAQMSNIADQLESADFDTALALAKLPEGIRGFGHVKEESIEAVKVRTEALSQKVFQRSRQEALGSSPTLV
ncbi:indolepyruvate ferredoxin oxidoreductase [Burkholderia stagnalis]|uniref:indolepyruvate ferredoxin oxidoreductase family protein n=1 Tax=Burkholderia stagnalis TaxID=1503054 RepID=UPI00075FE239|nr:indolepyruvate ferredoxin oxidoreductase family protein [Burkholderia stagnalis]KWK42837.1 indolepyruvate ferredoxin oxidoreductase [Burkholderia stagnalis]KWK48196.1 indolepyruvate ferredoxin oxidoreductase [Burkholderia stagnalis]